MPSLPRRQKWGDSVLEQDSTYSPNSHEELADLLLNIMTSSTDPEASLRGFLDEIIESGPEGRQLLEETRQWETYWLSSTSTVGSFNAAQRIRAMIAARLSR
jgi:hypothetical protein